MEKVCCVSNIFLNWMMMWLHPATANLPSNSLVSFQNKVLIIKYWVNYNLIYLKLLKLKPQLNTDSIILVSPQAPLRGAFD